MDHSPPGFFVRGDSPDNTGGGCHALLLGIFPTQGLNPHLLCLLHWQAGCLPLVPPGKPSKPWDLNSGFLNPAICSLIILYCKGLSYPLYSGLFFFFEFIWLHGVLVVAHTIFSCSIWDLVPWPNLSPLHWEHRVLATEPPGKSLCSVSQHL